MVEQEAESLVIVEMSGNLLIRVAWCSPNKCDCFHSRIQSDMLRLQVRGNVSRNFITLVRMETRVRHTR